MSSGAVNSGRGTPGVWSPEEGQRGQAAAEHGHDSKSVKKVRFCASEDDLAESFRGFCTLRDEHARTFRSKLTALWIRYCRETHDSCCSCRAWKVHLARAARFETPTPKKVQSVGTQTEGDLFTLFSSAERARLKRVADPTENPWSSKPFVARVPKRRRRKQDLRPYSRLWCKENPDFDNPWDSIPLPWSDDELPGESTGSDEADGDIDDDSQESDDFTVEGGTKRGTTPLENALRMHSSTPTLDPMWSV
ncbi:VP2 [Avian gyrovirus 13]|uniref:Dual specificity protein phosphatase VP2 n=1 Tax=Avian gyrovirus 13 TaxID=2781374 RepID=A0A7M1I6M4_9VIRU|nr:VP2 [Avian gyrovirus 13]